MCNVRMKLCYIHALKSVYNTSIHPLQSISAMLFMRFLEYTCREWLAHSLYWCLALMAIDSYWVWWVTQLLPSNTLHVSPCIRLCTANCKSFKSTADLMTNYDNLLSLHLVTSWVREDIFLISGIKENFSCFYEFICFLRNSARFPKCREISLGMRTLIT